MGKSKETFNKKEVRNKQAKKRLAKEKKRLEKKEQGPRNSFDDMIAWVDENGQLSSVPPDLSNKQEIEAESIDVSVPKAELRDGNMEKFKSGKVINYDPSKGYGFIADSETRDSYFIHINDCEEEIQAGDIVEFEIEKSPKGLKAKNVRIT